MPYTQHELPDITDAEACDKDKEYRRKIRLQSPGACSLEYQHAIDVFTRCLLRWNPETQKADGEGIFGNVIAFAPAHEEQGRHTLHMHCQIWVEELSSRVRHSLFNPDPQKREKARKDFYGYIDTIMSSSYSTKLNFTHYCLPTKEGETNISDNITEREIQLFRDARNETLCGDEEGRLLKCRRCNFRMSPVDVINTTFSERMKTYGIWTDEVDNKEEQNELASRLSMMTDAQLDAAAYTFLYDFFNETTEVHDVYPDSIWEDKDMRDLMLQFRFEHHAMRHVPTCFKKGNECRFLFPFKYCKSTEIYPNDQEVKIATPWHRLSDPGVVWVSPWLLTPKRDIGSEYVNTYNEALSQVFNCNTNVQVGDIWQIYYSTLYGSKSTQKEDSERVQRILQCVCKRLLKIEENLLSEGPNDVNDRKRAFTRGLGVMLSGLQAATSRHTVSATMAHLIISLGGTRFQFSHDFGTLLVSQLQALLEKGRVDAFVRRTTLNGMTKIWHDVSGEDYIHRPTELVNMCAYEMTMHYTKVLKPRKTLLKTLFSTEPSGSDQNNDSIDSNDVPSNESDFPSRNDNPSFAESLEFSELHPNQKFTCLKKRKHWVIPMTYYEGTALCGLEYLNLDDDINRTNSFTEEYREDYAKIALLMFYPFRTLEDTKINGSHWKLFRRELKLHRAGKTTTMWGQGFDILQHIEDRKMLQLNICRTPDEITENTKNRCTTPGSRSKGKKKTKKTDTEIDQ